MGALRPAGAARGYERRPDGRAKSHGPSRRERFNHIPAGQRRRRGKSTRRETCGVFPKVGELVGAPAGGGGGRCGEGGGWGGSGGGRNVKGWEGWGEGEGGSRGGEGGAKYRYHPACFISNEGQRLHKISNNIVP